MNVFGRSPCMQDWHYLLLTIDDDRFATHSLLTARSTMSLLVKQWETFTNLEQNQLET